MLTPEANTVMEYFISQQDTQNIYLDVTNPPTFLSNICATEMLSILKNLQDIGYITYDAYSHGDCLISVTNMGKHYKDQEKTSAVSPQNVFNIGTVTNSAFGNTGTTIINNGISFEEIQDFINSQNIPKADKDLLIAATEIVKTHIENDIPMKKGFLHRFGDLFNKYGETFTKIMLAIGTQFFISPPQ